MFKPIPLNLPPYPFTLIEKDSGLYIFDQLRKKHLFLTPEEWVRQHFVQYLINDKKYAKSLIKLEGGIKINQKQSRSDILIYSKEMQPIILVECKSPSVKINQKVFDQVSRYNLHYKVNYLVVTNGLVHYASKINYAENSFEFIEDLPLGNIL